MAELIFERPADYMQFEYRLRLERRPAYSLRAFARDLQMSPSSLSAFLQGRQGMSFERVVAIAKLLKWSDERREHFWDLVQSRFGRDSGTRSAALIRAAERSKLRPVHIQLDSFRLISDWYHFALLELARILPSEATVEAMAEKLGIPESTAREAMERMQRLDLVAYEGGVWKALSEVTHSGDDQQSQAVRQFQHQVLDLAHAAIEAPPSDEKESFAVILSINSRALAKARLEIRDAIIGILGRNLAEGDADSVQALTLQIFPVWKNPSQTESSRSNCEWTGLAEKTMI